MISVTKRNVLISVGLNQMKTANEKRKRLRELIASGEMIISPGAYDAISARLIEKMGFQCMSLGSYGTAAALYGLPDIGLVTLTQLSDHVRILSRVTDLPMCCDAEHGFYDVSKIWHTVEAFEDAGAASIQIEDIMFGKHTKGHKELIPAEETAQKICAACDARKDPDFVIFGRTDSIYATDRDEEEMIRRSNMYLDAGADIILITYGGCGYTTKDLAKVRHRIHGPVAVCPTLKESFADEKAAGVNYVGYWQVPIYAGYMGIKMGLQKLLETEDISKMDVWKYDEQQFNEDVLKKEFERYYSIK